MTSGVADHVHVRARVHLAEHPVEVERLGPEIEVEPLGQHDLEDVAGEDVLPGHLDRRLVATARHRRTHVGQRLVGVGRVEERLVDRSGPVGRQLLEPATASS